MKIEFKLIVAHATREGESDAILLGEKTFIISEPKWAHTFIALHNTIIRTHSTHTLNLFHYFLSVMMCTTQDVRCTRIDGLHI